MRSAATIAAIAMALTVANVSSRTPASAQAKGVSGNLDAGKAQSIVSTFVEGCLGNVPRFTWAGSYFEDNGFVPLGSRNDVQLYGKTEATAFVAENDKLWMCGMLVIGSSARPYQMEAMRWLKDEGYEMYGREIANRLLIDFNHHSFPVQAVFEKEKASLIKITALVEK